MALDFNYSQLPTLYYSNIGYCGLLVTSATNIPTSAGTAVLYTFNLNVGVWLVNASLGISIKNAASNVYKLSLSTTTSIDASFCSSQILTNNTSGLDLKLEVSRVFQSTGSNQLYVVFSTTAGANSSNSTGFNINYARIG